MERVISSEERIRRAEEIYAKRRMQNGIRVQADTVNRKKDYALFKKMVLQIVICLIIYLIFYLVKNSNYIFSENVINVSKEFLSYDIPFDKYYQEVCKYYNNNIKGFIYNKEETNDEAIVENVNDERLKNNILENEIIENKTENVNEEIVEESTDEELSQMEIDAREILSNYDMMIPLKGVISSRFGPRTPTDIVSANHAGLDIAADEGTVFVASMDGIVTFVSGERWIWKSYLC